MMTLDGLPVLIFNARCKRPRTADAPLSSAPAPRSSRVVREIRAIEREAIAKALIHSGGSKVHAAHVLKISRKKLYDRMNVMGSGCRRM